MKEDPKPCMYPQDQDTKHDKNICLTLTIEAESGSKPYLLPGCVRFRAYTQAGVTSTRKRRRDRSTFDRKGGVTQGNSRVHL